MSTLYIRYPAKGAGGGVTIYANIGAFPPSSSTGDLGVAADTGLLYEFNGSSWVIIAGSGVLTSIGTIDTGTPSANGAQDVSNRIILQSASATLPGLVNNTGQSFSGNKTFTGSISASNLSGTNTGDITLTAVGAAPSANAASLSGQVLTLQPADATHPGVVTTGAQTIAGAKTFSSDIIGNLTGNASGSAASFTGSLSGDITGTQSATVVSNIAGTTVSGTTGTGNVVFSASPTLTGTLTAATVTASGAVTGSNLSGTNTGDITLAAVGSSPSANGASLSGQALTLQPADATNPGLITSGTQTIGGAKTFSGAISASNLSGTNTGDITLAAVGSSPSANGASLSGQALTLQPFDGTHPGVVSASGGGTTHFLRSDNTWTTGSFTPVAPTVQKFLSGSGTYTLPSSPAPLYIKATLVGGGGGGSGSGSSGGGNGGSGTASTFGTTLLSAGGGGGGTWNGAGGSGGASSLGSGPIGLAITGNGGAGSGVNVTGGDLGSAQGPGSALGGGAVGATFNGAGNAGATNSGGAGSGGSATVNGSESGSGGGSGGYVSAIINSPSSTYSYVVGAAGSAGTAGTSGSTGGAGGSGIIIVEEFYQ